MVLTWRGYLEGYGGYDGPEVLKSVHDVLNDFKIDIAVSRKLLDLKPTKRHIYRVRISPTTEVLSIRRYEID